MYKESGKCSFSNFNVIYNFIWQLFFKRKVDCQQADFVLLSQLLNFIYEFIQHKTSIFINLFKQLVYLFIYLLVF